jgi:spore germination protein YaaH
MNNKRSRIGIAIIVVALIVTAVLSFNVELNLRMRMKAHQIIGSYEVSAVEPKVIYLRELEIEVSPSSEAILLLNQETGKTFFNLAWLKESLYTYHYDEAKKQLNLVGPSTFIIITEDGSTTINGVETAQRIVPHIVDGEVFVAYEDMEQVPNFEAFGIELRDVKENGHVVFTNTHIPYGLLTLSDKELVFMDAEQMAADEEKRRYFSSYLKMSSIFEPTHIAERTEVQEAIAYVDDQGQITVITEENTIGIVKGSDERMSSITKAEAIFPETNDIPLNEKVMLVWEAVYSFNPDTTMIPTMTGINVVSPTWYELTNAEGRVSSKVSSEYIEWATKNDYAIWPLVSNAFDIDRTHEFLISADARERFISTMIREAKTYGFQGINLDFENVYLADKDRLTHFVNEFSYAMEENGLILSMDVTIMGGSDNWSKCYDHPYLGKLVDYLIIMTYDEYWAASPVSGPVASYDWVKRNMEDLTQVVDPKKLVLGLPLYSRVWRERPSTERPNQMVTRSSAIGMQVQNDFVGSKNLSPIWDEEAKLYYAAFIDGDNLVKIWIENAETLSHKASLVNEFGLGGVAAWQRSFATNDIWEAISSALGSER